MVHACGSTISRASLLLLAFCSPRGTINCTRQLYVPLHPTMGRLINGRCPSRLWARVIPFIFPYYIRLLWEIISPFLEKTLKRSKALQHFLSQNTQESIAIPVRIPGGSFESLRDLELMLPVSVPFPIFLYFLLCCSHRLLSFVNLSPCPLGLIRRALSMERTCALTSATVRYGRIKSAPNGACRLPTAGQLS